MPGPKKQSKHQRDIARATMKRLHKEGRMRIGRKPPPNPKPKPDAPPQTPPQPPPPPPPIAPEPIPETKAAFMTVQPDTALFGSETVPPPQADKLPPAAGSLPPGGQPGGTTPPPPGDIPPTGQHTTVLPKDTRALAVMVWMMILNLLAILFGPAMFPRKVGNAPGEVPYDENEMVIGAWMDYFASIGLKPLSPLMNLGLAILAYMLPRAQFVVITVKKWFSQKTAREPQSERTPSPDETPAPETAPEKKEQPAPPPETTPPKPEPMKPATREEAAAVLEELG